LTWLEGGEGRFPPQRLHFREETTYSKGVEGSKEKEQQQEKKR